MIITMVRTWDLTMKIHDRKPNVLLTIEAFSECVGIYAFQQNPIKRILFFKHVELLISVHQFNIFVFSRA